MATHDRQLKEVRGIAGVCDVMVVYEDADALDAALNVCKRLVTQFEGDIEFHFTWWGFKFFKDPAISNQAAELAIQTDLIVFSSNEAEVPASVKAWFEAWIPQRQPTEGALVVLPTRSSAGAAEEKHPTFLEAIARRANMDFLALRRASTVPAPDQFGSSQYLNPDFREPPDRHRPAEWGINE
jgi:hypothetical protein